MVMFSFCPSFCIYQLVLYDELFLGRAIREGISEEVTFEWKPERSKGMNMKIIWKSVRQRKL